MKFNGWQRLWVVVSLLWAVVVAGIGFMVWPAPLEVSEVAIYERMGPASANLQNVYEVIANQVREESASQRQGFPPAGTLRELNGEEWVSDGTQFVKRSTYRGPIPTTLTPEEMAAIGFKVVRTRPLPIAVDGRKIHFASIPADRSQPPQFDPQVVAQQYRAAWSKELWALRWRTFALLVAAWFTGASIAYLAGWSVGWIRRGFATAT